MEVVWTKVTNVALLFLFLLDVRTRERMEEEQEHSATVVTGVGIGATNIVVGDQFQKNNKIKK